MKTECCLSPDDIWKNKADEFLDVIDKHNGENGEYIREQILYPRIFRHMGQISGKILFDGGCGEGEIGRLAIDKGAIVIGSDIVPQFTREANVRSSGREYVVLADLEHTLPFSSDSFDVVCYNLVLMWLPEIEDLAKETKRVMKPDGQAVISLLHPWTGLAKVDETVSEEPELMLQHGVGGGVFLRTINKTAGPFLYYQRSISEYIATFANVGLHLHPTMGFEEVFAPKDSKVSMAKKLFPEFLILTFTKEKQLQ